MNIKTLCVITILLTFLIFLGNRSAARNGCAADEPGCEKCRCKVTMPGKSTDLKKQPSCTVVFNAAYGRISSADPPPKGSDDDLIVGLDNKPLPPKPRVFDSCGFLLYCDKEASAGLSCRNEKEKLIGGPAYAWNSTNVWGNQKCKVTCESRPGTKIMGIPVSDSEKVVNSTCNHWERPLPPKKKPVKTAPTQPPAKKPQVKRPGMGMFAGAFVQEGWSVFADVTNVSIGIDDEYNTAPVRELAVQEDALDPKVFINDSALWKVIEGEAGMDEDTLMVADGQAKAHSFCTGDTVSLAAPKMMTMPTCLSDAGGHWEGAFARPLPKNAPPDTRRSVVVLNLDLRKTNGTLTGELKTDDGVYTVTGSQSRDNIGLEAVRPGTRAKISLQGTVSKSSIVFGGNEDSAEGVSTYRLVGFFRRPYIADSVLPPGIVNLPYSFALTAFAPGGDALTFRLAARAASRPAPRSAPGNQKEINWFTNAEDLRGRNGERFTFACPANGSLSGYLYGTDSYSDSSAVCKAAVHAGRISRESGGVVTIEIRPNAAAYPATNRHGVLSSTYSYGTGKGSFVFASGEPVKAITETARSAERAPLPAGISFDPATGVFSGTPTQTGTFELTVTALDEAGNVFEQPLTLTVGKMALQNGLLHDAFAGEPYSAALSVIGGQPPYRFSGAPPRGLEIDPSTGEISGTPVTPILFAPFDVVIRDSQNNTETQRVVLSIRATTILGSHYLPEASVGVPYRTQFQAIGNPSVRWKAYPTNVSLIGLTLNEQSGVLYGTPTKPGSFLIQMRAEGGESVSRSFTLTVD